MNNDRTKMFIMILQKYLENKMSELQKKADLDNIIFLFDGIDHECLVGSNKKIKIQVNDDAELGDSEFCVLRVFDDFRREIMDVVKRYGMNDKYMLGFRLEVVLTDKKNKVNFEQNENVQIDIPNLNNVIENLLNNNINISNSTKLDHYKSEDKEIDFDANGLIKDMDAFEEIDKGFFKMLMDIMNANNADFKILNFKNFEDFKKHIEEDLKEDFKGNINKNISNKNKKNNSKLEKMSEEEMTEFLTDIVKSNSSNKENDRKNREFEEYYKKWTENKNKENENKDDDVKSQNIEENIDTDNKDVGAENKNKKSRKKKDDNDKKDDGKN